MDTAKSMDAQSPATTETDNPPQNHTLVLDLFRLALQAQRPIEVRPDGSFVVLVTTEAHPQGHPQAHPHTPMPRPHDGDVGDVGDVGDGDVPIVPKVDGDDVPTGLCDVLALYARHAALDAPTVRDALGISLKAAQHRLARLLAQSLVAKAGGGRQVQFVLCSQTRDRVLPDANPDAGDYEATDVAMAEAHEGGSYTETTTPESYALVSTTPSKACSFVEAEQAITRTQKIEDTAHAHARVHAHARAAGDMPKAQVGPKKTLPAVPPQDATRGVEPEPYRIAARIARFKQLETQATRAGPKPVAWDEEDDDWLEAAKELADTDGLDEFDADEDDLDDADTLAATQPYKPPVGRSFFDDDE